MSNRVTKINHKKLAIFGEVPAFDSPVPVGQFNFPEWEVYEQSFRDLFNRQYYTNHGPLVEQFESLLAERLQVKNAICVTNATIGLSMVADALGIKGTIAMPSFTFIASAQSMVWSNLMPTFCEVDPRTHHMDLACLAYLLANGASAVLAVNLWGDAYDISAIEDLAARYGVPLFFDSAQSFGCSINNIPLGGFGKAEVFSFHATKVLSTGEGGCITTNDDHLAELLRNIRSSYGIRKQIQVKRTSNGRMSEAQAAIGLLNLKNLDKLIERNRILHAHYRDQLRSIPGLSVRIPNIVDKTNWQYLVIEVHPEEYGINRDLLRTVLHKEGVLVRRYFSPGIHRCPPFDQISPTFLPETDSLCTNVLQLPLGARTSEDTVARIANLIKTAHEQADRIRDILPAA